MSEFIDSESGMRIAKKNQERNVEDLKIRQLYRIFQETKSKVNPEIFINMVDKLEDAHFYNLDKEYIEQLVLIIEWYNYQKNFMNIQKLDLLFSEKKLRLLIRCLDKRSGGGSQFASDYIIKDT